MSNSIIITNPTPTPTPLTSQQLLQRQATLLAKSQADAFKKVMDVFVQTAEFIWADPTKAQERFDAFTAAGFKASDLFVNAAAYITLATTLTGATPTSPVPPGWSAMMNPDGTVTVVPPE